MNTNREKSAFKTDLCVASCLHSTHKYYMIAKSYNSRSNVFLLTYSYTGRGHHTKQNSHFLIKTLNVTSYFGTLKNHFSKKSFFQSQSPNVKIYHGILGTFFVTIFFSVLHDWSGGFFSTFISSSLLFQLFFPIVHFVLK